MKKKRKKENVIVFPQHADSHYVMMITKHSRAGEPDRQKLKVALGSLSSHNCFSLSFTEKSIIKY